MAACQNQRMKFWPIAFATAFIHATCLAESGQPSSSGFDIMTSRQSGNCIACHELPQVDGIVSNLGPSLKGVGSRWTRTELTQWVKDARQINSQTLMPPFGTLDSLTKASPLRAILSDAQITQVVDTLQSWK
jgi:sulfur-oxidizing protein SoxX